MSALGQADLSNVHRDVRLVPRAEIGRPAVPSTTPRSADHVIPLLMLTAIKGLAAITEQCSAMRLRTVCGHSLCPGRNGPGGKACVSGGDTIARNQNPSASHTRKNNGSHGFFALGSIKLRSS
jgi:hypothetical protein